jgi:hypothetical protein
MKSLHETTAAVSGIIALAGSLIKEKRIHMEFQEKREYERETNERERVLDSVEHFEFMFFLFSDEGNEERKEMHSHHPFSFTLICTLLPPIP